MPHALEITTFNLAAGLTGADFVAANDDINEYLRRRPGFRWRHIAEDGDGGIIDIVAWDTRAEARASASGIMTEMAASPVHATIDHGTVDFRIVTVLQHTDRDEPTEGPLDFVHGQELSPMSDEREVQEVLARYVRATDLRDGKAMRTLFADDAVVRSYSKTAPDSYERFAEMVGAARVEYAVDHYMAPHPEGGSSHHVTADHTIEIDGDSAHMNAQFIVFEIRAAARPADGWPDGAFGAQGTIRPIESGYYDTDLSRIDGEWKIIRHSIRLDMPYVIPDA
ncbi:nuclear transport factor 2 family protein [Nonomuraea jabiensis]|uniref:nuclear transport factor 2 family protein n=1 Tax=Nonomuraea jabiensis TaxID=882448 RepID=UPI0036A29E0E